MHLSERQLDRMAREGFSSEDFSFSWGDPLYHFFSLCAECCGGEALDYFDEYLLPKFILPHLLSAEELDERSREAKAEEASEE